MKAMAAKQPSNDFHRQHQEVVQAPVLQNEFPSTDAIVLQRMSACPCDGGCPLCEGGMVIQPKLRIGEPGDWYEREADKVADEVVSRINAPHRKAVQHQGLFEESEEQIQIKPLAQQIHSFSEQNFTAGGETGITPNLEMSIRRAQGDGNFLPEQVREPVEQVFGTDFSKVRIHTDAVSHRQNQALKANAFTTGQDIFFREGAYNPGNNQGRELLAHELTHVMQQKKSKSSTKIIQLSPITDFQTALLTVYEEDDIREQLTRAINSIQLADLEEAEELFEMLNNPCSEESLADDFNTFLDPEYQADVLNYLSARILRLRDEFHTQVESQRPQAPDVRQAQQVPPRQQQLTEEVARPPPLHSRTEPVQGEEEISYLENEELREEINSILEPGLYPDEMSDEQLEYEIRLIRLWFSRNPTDQLNDQLMEAQRAREIVAFERQGIPSEPQQQLTEEVARPPPLHSRTEPVQGEEEISYLENEELREEINSILEPGLYPDEMSDEQLEYEIRLIRLWFSRNPTDQLNDQLMEAQRAREIVAFERQGIPSEPQEETSMFLQAVPSEDFNASVSPSGGVLTYYRDLERRVVLEVDPEAQTERVPFAYQYVPPTPARQWPIIRIVAAPGVSIRMEEFPLGHIISLQNPVVEIFRVQDLEQVPLQGQPIHPNMYVGRTDIGVQELIITLMEEMESTEEEATERAPTEQLEGRWEVPACSDEPHILIFSYPVTLPRARGYLGLRPNPSPEDTSEVTGPWLRRYFREQEGPILVTPAQSTEHIDFEGRHTHFQVMVWADYREPRVSLASIQLRPPEVEQYLVRLRSEIRQMPRESTDEDEVRHIFSVLEGSEIIESGGPVSYLGLDLSNPDNLGAVMQVLFRHYRHNVAVPLRFLEQVQAQTGRQPVTRPEDTERMIQIRATHPGAQAIGLVPTMYMIIRGTGTLGEQVQTSSTAFFQGLDTGMSQRVDRSTIDQLLQRLQASSLLTAVFPVFFAGGVAVGILEEGYESISDIIEMITDFESFVNGIEALIGNFLRSPENANAMGVACGQRLGARIIELTRHGTIGFTYELGKLMGPIIGFMILAILFPELSFGRLPVLFRRLRDFSGWDRLRRLVRRRQQPSTPEQPDMPSALQGPERPSTAELPELREETLAGGRPPSSTEPPGPMRPSGSDAESSSVTTTPTWFVTTREGPAGPALVERPPRQLTVPERRDLLSSIPSGIPMRRIRIPPEGMRVATPIPTLRRGSLAHNAARVLQTRVSQQATALRRERLLMIEELRRQGREARRLLNTQATELRRRNSHLTERQIRQNLRSARLTNNLIDERMNQLRLSNRVIDERVENAFGPVLSGVFDPQTGHVFYGLNQEINLTDLHTLLRQRLEPYFHQWPGPEHPESAGIPGTHAEIYALNQALLFREEVGVPATAGDFMLVNQWLIREGTPPRCVHCEFLTQGVQVVNVIDVVL